MSLGPRHRIDTNILESVNMLNVEQRVKQLRLQHVHNIFNETCPEYLKQNFNLVSDNSRYLTRSASSDNFIVPSYKTCTFYYNAIKDWNTLPVSIKNISSKPLFKTSLKQHLQNQSLRDANADFIYF